MVGPRELPNAVALNSGLLNASRVIGPAIAGVLIATAGVGVCFLVNTLSFVAVLAALLAMREDELYPVTPRSHGHPPRGNAGGAARSPGATGRCAPCSSS